MDASDEPIIVGGQLAEETFEWKPMLDGMGPEKIVTIFNPLKNPFRVIYARERPNADVSLNPGLAFARERAGLPLHKQSGIRGNSVQQAIVLQPGQSMNLPGNIAQKAVQDLITYILSNTGKKSKIADPYSRSQVEKDLILSVKEAYDVMNQQSQTVDEITQAELKALNPDVTKPTEAPEAPDPPPGKGITYESKHERSRKTPSEDKE